MKTSKVFGLGLLIIGAIASGNVWARGHGGHGHRGHHHSGVRVHPSFGLYFGSPFYSFPFYPYPYYRYPYAYPYYPPSVVTVPSTPPVYIEQSPPVAREYPSGYWYYCSNPEGYYPYIKECPNGWQQVEPAPSAPK